jgi:hypothetical protein
MSRTHAPLDGWLRGGRRGPRPAHVDGCARCREELAAIDETRAWFAEPAPLPADRVAGMRFALQAATRAIDRPRRRVRGPIVAGALLLSAAAAGAGHLLRPPPPAAALPEGTPDAPVARPLPPPRWSMRPAETPRRQVASIARPPSPAVDVDAGFHIAWRRLASGDHAGAAAALDELLASGLDDGRRADVLFWSARAHAAAGRPDRARARLEQLLRDHPSAWHRADAEELLETLTPR